MKIKKVDRDFKTGVITIEIQGGREGKEANCLDLVDNRIKKGAKITSDFDYKNGRLVIKINPPQKLSC